MADKTTLVARLKQIINQRGKEISEAEAQARVGDRFYSEAFGYGTEIKPEEQQRLSEIADEWLNST
jgi:Zn-dependent oligopeptidase